MGDFLVAGSKKLRKVMFFSPAPSQIKVKNRYGFFINTNSDSNLAPIVSSLLPSSGFDSVSASPPLQSQSGGKINQVVLFIIVIVAVVFFISGLLHLLVRFLIKHRSSSPVSEFNRYPDFARSGTVQRQLQQLFNLHDSGLDQAFIDALPVFVYEEIMGLEEPFDCAVCLCEFSKHDKLRLLPNCSHAFHVDCIDTWLLSNSTCPLCRGSLFTPGIAIDNPIFEFGDLREEDGFEGDGVSLGNNYKPAENAIICGKRVFSVRLGKLKSSNEPGNDRAEAGETSCSSLDTRRCFSMGSYQYVVADSELQVALRPGRGGAGNGSASMRLVKGRGWPNGNSVIDGDRDGKRINFGSKCESFSVSKIWQWSRKGKLPTSSETYMASSGPEMPWTDRNQKT